MATQWSKLKHPRDLFAMNFLDKSNKRKSKAKQRANSLPHKPGASNNLRKVSAKSNHNHLCLMSSTSSLNSSDHTDHTDHSDTRADSGKQKTLIKRV